MVATLEAQVAQPEPGVFPFGIARQELHIKPLGVFLFALLLENAREVVDNVSQIRRDLKRALVAFGASFSSPISWRTMPRLTKACFASGRMRTDSEYARAA